MFDLVQEHVTDQLSGLFTLWLSKTKESVQAGENNFYVWFVGSL